MPRITKELLRSRTEHNEGCLSTLEEITLHQFELEKIEFLETYCRHLKILYLQNNIIERMEGLSKLKELEYLNLALNNISRIENIEGCESLRKLDLTVNFIDLEELEDSMVSLSRCPLIKELYLTGNPCTDWSGCRDFVVALVSTLDSLDGKEITPTDRIRASQRYDDLLIDLNHKIEMKKIEKAQKEENERLKQEQDACSSEIIPDIPPEEQKSAYTKESRREMYLEMAADKEKREKEKNPEKFQEPKKESPMFRSDGEIRQCNEGKYKFTLREWDDPEWTLFEIEVPKYLDTSFLDVNIDPKWVSVRVKGKLTQLRLQEEISVGLSETKRSQMTGILSIRMKKINANEYVRSILKQEKEEKEKKEKEIQSQKEKEEQERREKLKLCDRIDSKYLLRKEDHSTFDDVPDLE